MALAGVGAGCGSDESDSSEQALAEQLVAATQAAGVAPRLTVDTAKSLYGTDAEAVCKAFDGELSTSAKNQLLGRFGLSRRKTITDHAVTYGGLVVDTYCPEVARAVRQGRRRCRSVRAERIMSDRTVDDVTPAAPEGGIKAVAMVAWPALAMLMVASVGSIAQLSDSASFGLGAVTVYLLPALLFLLPVGLVSAELATSNRGGIFVWVKDAFGDRTGFQATWFVFMNSVTLYPSLLSFGAAALATAFGRPDLATNGAYMGTVVLVVFWLATWIVSRGMKSSTGISNIGLALGTITPALFLIFFMFAWLIDGKTSQVHYDGLSSLAPPVTGLSSIALVVGTFVAFAGLEVNAVHIAHLKGPPKNYLKSVMLAALTVFVMYLLGSIAISVAVPDASLELTSGASQAFTVYADGFGVPGLSNVLSGLLVLGALAASIAWIAGPSRSMWLVGKAGYLPRGLQKTNKNDVQMPLLLLQGAVVTRAVVRVRGGTEHVGGVRHAAGRVDLAVHVDVRVHVRRGDQAAQVAAESRATDQDQGIAGDCRHRHPVGDLGDRPRPDAAGGLLELVGRDVWGDHRHRGDRARHSTAVHLPLPQAGLVDRDRDRSDRGTRRRRLTPAARPRSATWTGADEVDLCCAADRDGAERFVAAGGTCESVVVPGHPHGFVHIAPMATVTINFERPIDEFLWRYLAPVPIKSS